MGAVGAFVHELAPVDAPPEALHRFAALAFHGTHFTRAGCPLYLLSAAAARYLVEGSPGGVPEPPTEAGYLQLPQHLFWTEPPAGEAPESVDGVFWTAPGGRVLHALAVTGMRPDRAGLAAVPLPEAPLSEAPLWLEAEARPGGGDFSSALPGADIDGLYSFQAAGEVLKLLARFFAYASGTPAALRRFESRPSPEGPAASALDYHWVTLDG
jgi:hypothetical protein